MRHLPRILLLTIAWLALTGSATLANLVLAFVLGILASSFAGRQRSLRDIRARPFPILALALRFLHELLLSGLRVARLVLTPRMRLEPGIFAYPLKVDRDFEITLLANLITLTPGTLSVDVSENRRILFVHAIDCSDPEQARRDIADGFERRILEAFR